MSWRQAPRKGVKGLPLRQRAPEPKELQAQHADEERLGEREAQLEAFAVAVREGLDALDFEGRQRLVRLLIERVVVAGEHVTIEHAVPLSGQFCRLR